MADLVQANAERLQHAGGDPLAFSDQAQEQVLGADVVVTQPSGFVYGQLDYALCPWGQSHLADDRPIAPPDDELHGGPNLGQFDVHVLENARSDALSLAHQTEEKVLRPDVVVVEPLRFVLSERQDLTSPVRELVETIHQCESLFCLIAGERPWGHASTPRMPCNSAQRESFGRPVRRSEATGIRPARPPRRRPRSVLSG